MASEKIDISLAEAIDIIESNYPTQGYVMLQNALDIAIDAIKEKIHREELERA